MKISPASAVQHLCYRYFVIR